MMADAEQEKMIDDQQRDDLEQRAERAAMMRESGLGLRPKPRIFLGHEAARRALRR